MIAEGQHKRNIKAFKDAEKAVDRLFNITSAPLSFAPKVNDIKLIARENYKIGLYFFHRRFHEAKCVNASEAIILQIGNLQNLKVSVIKFYLLSHAQFNHRFDYIINCLRRQSYPNDCFPLFPSITTKNFLILIDITS